MNNDINRMTAARKIMSRATTFGTVAAGLCMQLFDDGDSIHWDPAVLDEALSAELGAEHVHPAVLQRIHAVSAVLGGRGFFEDPAVFHAVCVTLLDPDANPAAGNGPPEPLEMAWACTEAKALIGPGYTEQLFHPQVARYCGAALQSLGFSFPPRALQFADFPEPVYPDPQRYADETVLNAWLDAQDSQARDVDATVDLLAEALKQQLLELRPFAADPKPFERLAGGKQQSRAASR